MTEVLEPQLPEMQMAEESQQRIQCDSCSARAGILVSLPFGTLSFCIHHYNKNAVALTEQGGIAKLLTTSIKTGPLDES
jgi:hypothetical protein